MIRGHVSIYKSLFEEPIAEKVNKKKGRNVGLLKKRNELIVHRYWYLIKIKDLNYPCALDQLKNEEFFLTQRTISLAIQSNFHILSEIKAIRPDVSFFRKKYPFMVW